MTFYQFSLYLERLEATTLRNSMVEILSELFAASSSSEIGHMCYLLQGRVAPLYQAIEFGVADKMMVRAIVQATQKDQEKVNASFKELGDLGKTVEHFKVKKNKDIENSLTVDQVYGILRNVAESNGEGSQEKKVTLLSDLLVKADPLSCRYIVRITLAKLRLGFSDMTMLDALSWTIAKSKDHREVIEKAYNVRPDLGFIAQSLKSEGIHSISSITPKVGVPILMARANRLGSSPEILEKLGRCAIEFKYDGLRLQVHKHGRKVKLFSRNLEDLTTMFPDITQALEIEISAKEVIFEGEIVAYNPQTGTNVAFQQTMQRRRKYNIEEKAAEIPVKLFAYELLYHEGKNYIHLPYTERKACLKSIIQSKKTIFYAQETIVSDEKILEKLFHQSVEEGFEGIIAKRLEGVYQAGMRGWNWIKFKRAMSKKLTDTFDVLVMGYTKGEGKRTIFGVGQFLTGVFDDKDDRFKTISKIGTGLTDEQFHELKKRIDVLALKEKPKNYEVDKLLEADVWLQPSLVVEVAADEITRSQIHTAGRTMGPTKSGNAQEVRTPGFALRFPRLERFRDDKSPTEATTVTEVEKMYSLQGKGTTVS